MLMKMEIKYLSIMFMMCSSKIEKLLKSMYIKE